LLVVAAITFAFSCAMLANGRDSSANPIISSPTPIPQAHITIRHMLDGVPFIAPADGPWNARVGDSECGIMHGNAIGFDRLVDVIDWPWSTCATGNPVSFCYRIELCSDEFFFDGNDATIDMPWPRSAFLGVPIITAHFAHNGQPQSVTVTAWSFSTDGETCDSGTTTPVLTNALTALWWGGDVCGQPASQGRAQFTTQEFGDIAATFTWQGADLTFDIDTGALITPTPSPSPVTTTSPNPSATPAKLPSAGGPRTATGVPIVGIGAVIALLGAATVACAWTGRKRRW
jgi:hypothetical protein